MTVRELILLRHGESEGNLAAAEANAAGAELIDVPARDADVRLSSDGRIQAEAVGRHLAGLAEADRPDIVWCSPYERARETASIAMEGAGFDVPLRIDERLRDRDLGILDALTSIGVETRFPEEAQRRLFHGKFYYRPPGGESWTDVALRLRSFLRDLDAVPAERALVVCHDAVVSVFRYVCEGIPERELLEEARTHPVPNASLTRLVRQEDGLTWRASSVNDVAHLERFGAEVTQHGGTVDGTRP